MANNDFLILAEVTAKDEDKKFYTEIFAESAEDAYLKEKAAKALLEKNEKVASAEVIGVYKKVSFDIVAG